MLFLRGVLPHSAYTATPSRSVSHPVALSLPSPQSTWLVLGPLSSRFPSSHAHSLPGHDEPIMIPLKSEHERPSRRVSRKRRPSKCRVRVHPVCSTPHSASLLASSQPHTCERYFSIFTLLVFISTIQGCSIILHGVALLEPSFSRLPPC